MNIFDTYTASELRQIFRDGGPGTWPDAFIHWIHDEMASDLLDQWLETVDDDEYMEKARIIIEDLTYGYRDEDGKEMLDFDTTVDNNGNRMLPFKD